MSQLTINCPHCSQQVLGDTAYAGQALACPSCGGEFVMPGDPAPQPQQQEAQHGHVAPAPQLKRTGRPNLKRAGVGVRSAQVVGSATAGRLAPSQQQQQPATAASQQMVPATQQIPGGASGLLYQTPAGFGKLWADPVTGQREACDGMGPGKSLMFGLIFLFGLPIIIYTCIANRLLNFGIPLGPTPFGRASFKDHLLATTNLTILLATIALMVWLFRLMCAKKGSFGEILLATGFASFWAFIFMFLASLIGRAQSFGNPSMVIVGLMTALSLLAGFSFCTIIYGAFRNLAGASGAASFWLAPTSILSALLLFFGYVWLLSKIMS